MIYLYSPENEIDLAIIKSLLEAADIPFFVHNDHFGTMKIGPRIDLLNKKTLMIPPEFQNEAKQILSEFIYKKGKNNEKSRPQYTIKDKIRMIIEMIIFSWFVPGNRFNRKNDKEKDDC